MNWKPGDLLQHRGTEWGLRIMLGGVFLYAGASKLGAPQAFADSIAAFVLPWSVLSNLVALGLPVIEVAIGGMLLGGWRLRAAALGAVGLMTVFTLVLGSALARGMAVDCGCFGAGYTAMVGSTWLALGRDLLLETGAILLYWQADHADRRRLFEHESARSAII